jgi:hypothetical protein
MNVMMEELLESLFDYAYASDRLSRERYSSRIDCKICGSSTQLFDVVDFKKCCDPSLYPDGLAGIRAFMILWYDPIIDWLGGMQRRVTATYLSIPVKRFNVWGNVSD